MKKLTKNSKTSSLVKLLMLITTLSLFMTGCMYPKPDTSSGVVVTKEAMRNTQGAIEQYITTTGVLPIHNSDSSVAKYEKFRVNFGKLVDEKYIDYIPNSAFESGGNFYYLVLNEEEEPIVKAQSILLTQQVIDLQTKVTDYITAHGDIPAGMEAYEGIYYIDFDKLNIKKPSLKSVYTGNVSELLVSSKGNVYIDYASDIMQLLQKDSSLIVSDQLDLRELLIANSDYVPVKSTTYKLVNGDPVAFE